MTTLEHEARCDKVLYDDLKFHADCQSYGIGRARLYCIIGHSVYLDVAPPAAVVRLVEPRLVMEPCSRCDELFDAGPEGKRQYCPDCLVIRRIENGRDIANYRPVRIRHCMWCKNPIDTPKYCDAVCRMHYNARARVQKKARHQAETAAAFA